MGNRYHTKSKKSFYRFSTLVLGLCLLIQPLAMAELPPVVENQTFEIHENAPANTSVGTVLVQASGDEALVYEISGGEDVSVFLIDGATGELTVREGQTLDYETKPTFILNVRVSQGEESSEAQITANLVNVQLPVVSTGDAQDVTTEEAKIPGTITSVGSGTIVAVQYGTAAELDDSFDPENAENKQTMAGGEGEISFQFGLNELEDGQQYFYRVVAKNSEGITYGETKSFTTISFPRVTSITIRDSNPTNSEEVSFLVTFNEIVNGVDIGDFELDLEDVAGGDPLQAKKGTLTLFGGDGDQYVVTVVGISGDGVLRLFFRDDNSVKNLTGLKAGGEEIGDGDYVDGESYTIDNRPPEIFTLLYTNEDSYVTYSFSVSDAPSDPNDLIFEFDSDNDDLIGDENYEVSGSGSIRKIRITPNPHQHGNAFISIKVRDASGNVSPNPIKLHIVVRAVADAPLLLANDVSGPEDTDIPLEVAASLVDQDGSEEFKEIKIAGVPEGGTLSAGSTSGNGIYYFSGPEELNNLKFTPKQDDFGTYTFTLSATVREKETDLDLLASREASATKDFIVEIIPVNDAPAFVLSTNKVEKEEDFTETVTITLTDQSPANEEEPITYSLDPASVDFANLSIDENTGTITITAKKDAFGSAFVKVTADDGQEENRLYEQNFELIINSVNDAPVFTLDPSGLELEEDFTETHYVEIIKGEVPANETSQQVQYSVVVKGGDAPIANVRVVEKDGKPQLEITSKADANGTQIFVVTAEEDIAITEANRTYTREFELIINAVNDLPKFVLVPDNLTLDEDFENPPYAIITPLEVPLNEKEQATSYSVAVKDGSEPIAELVIVEETEGIFKLKINAIENANGVQVFTVTAHDGIESYSQDFTLTINPINDAPVFTLSTDRVEKEEDFEGTVTVTIASTSSPADETEAVTYSLDPASVDFANISIDAATGTVSITAKPDAHGSATITVIANDGQPENNLYEQSFELIVTPVNDAPVFTLSTNRVEKEEDFEGTETVTVGTTSSPADETETIIYSLDPASVDFANISIDAATGTVSITAKKDAHGSATIKVIASDGKTTNATHEESFELIVTPVNDAPVFTLSTDRVEKEEDFEGTETVTVGTTSSPADETETITYSLDPASVDFANISIDAATGTVSITAKKDAHGSATIKVVASDGKTTNATHEESFELIVTPVNDAPVFTLSTNRVEKEEDFTETVVVTLTDGSPADETEAVSYTISPTTVAFANVSFNGTSGEVTITSKPDLHGSQEFTITASDASGSTAQQTFILLVNAVNDAPVFTLSTDRVEKEEDFEGTETVTVAPTSSPADETEAITYSLDPASVDFANISIDAATGTVSITAKKDAYGSATIKVIANDGQILNNTYEQSFQLIVSPVNDDQPYLARDLADRTVYEDEAFEHIISIGENAAFVDPDGNETLTFSASLADGAALPEWLSFDADSRTFSGTPEGKDVGEYEILVRATDPEGNWIEDDFTLTVLNVNDAPEVSSIDDVSVKLGFETPAEATFTVFDEETPMEDLKITIESSDQVLIPVSSIQIIVSGENHEIRTLMFYPPGIETLGSSTITITVSDGEAQVSETFTFTVEYNQIALDIPDLITPNNDNRNDTWNIQYLSLYENNEVRVFDRNGRVVFQAKNYSTAKEWDGTQDGRDAPEGIYMYEIRLNGGAIVERGTLTIAR